MKTYDYQLHTKNIVKNQFKVVYHKLSFGLAPDAWPSVAPSVVIQQQHQQQQQQQQQQHQHSVPSVTSKIQYPPRYSSTPAPSAMVTQPHSTSSGEASITPRRSARQASIGTSLKRKPEAPKQGLEYEGCQDQQDVVLVGQIHHSKQYRGRCHNYQHDPHSHSSNMILLQNHNKIDKTNNQGTVSPCTYDGAHDDTLDRDTPILDVELSTHHHNVLHDSHLRSPFHNRSLRSKAHYPKPYSNVVPPSSLQLQQDDNPNHTTAEPLRKKTRTRNSKRLANYPKPYTNRIEKPHALSKEKIRLIAKRRRTGKPKLDSASFADLEKNNSQPHVANSFHHPPAMQTLATINDNKNTTIPPNAHKYTQSPPQSSIFCGFCPSNLAADSSCDEIVGPFAKRNGKLSLYTHLDCAMWTPEIYVDPKTGTLRNVYDAFSRGRRLVCGLCNEKGATVGCYVNSCRRVFHYRCLIINGGCVVDEFFTSFCSKHVTRAKSPTYLQLMKAQIQQAPPNTPIKEESTFGLDTPHSQFTGIRRNETELIFSAKWQVASHTGADDQDHIIISARLWKAVDKTDPFKLRDRLCTIHPAIFDFYTSQMFKKVVVPNHTNPHDEEIDHYDDGRDISVNRKRNRNHIDHDSSTEEGDDDNDNDSNNNISMPHEDHDHHQSHTFAHHHHHHHHRPTVFLLRNFRKSPKYLPGQIFCTKNLEKDKHKVNHHSSFRKNKKNTQQQQQLGQDKQQQQDGDLKNNANTLQIDVRGRHTGWKIFLHENLEKEKNMRPENSLSATKTNLARLWSLIGEQKRQVYENKAKSLNEAV